MTITDEPDYAAVFSVDATSAAIYVAQAAGPGSAIAQAHPSIGDDPLAVLRSLGYVLAFPSQRHLFRGTMKATGYQRVRVVAS